jgi:hypothetical protein
MEVIEYRVREVKRFIVTRYVKDNASVGSSQCGEFDNRQQAETVMMALARQDRHDRVPELRQMFVDGEPFGNEPVLQIANGFVT